MINRTRASLVAFALASSCLLATPTALAAAPGAASAAPTPNCSASTCFWDRPNYRGHKTEIPIFIGECRATTRQIRSVFESVRGMYVAVYHGKKCQGRELATTENGPLPSIPAGAYSYWEFR